MAYLITHSLLSAWKYQYDCYESQQEEAQAAFLRTLNKFPSEDTEALQAGRAFEAAVYNSDPEFFPAAIEASKIIEGSARQVKMKRSLEIDGTDFLLFGIADAIKSGVIYDIKYLSHSIQSTDVYGKWYASTQHPMYLALCPEALRFVYVASDGADLYIEKYERSETADISDIIRDFVADIKASGLWHLYTEKWKAR